MSLPARALVVGLARQGQAAVAALERHGVEVVGADRKLGNDDDLRLLDGVEVLVKSGGVPNEAPLVAAARERGVAVWSDVELAARILPNPFLAVTGTNGKTTTTALLGAIFEAAGRDAAVAGNIGHAVCALDGEVAPEAWIVCELSSFQTEWIDTFRPRVAVLLNLEPDHLDRHGTFEAYAAAKLRLFENQAVEDVAVLPHGFGPVPGAARRVEFEPAGPLVAEPLIPGAHNRENAAAATEAARAAGIDDAAIASALATFPGVPHRLEPVGEIGGVRYVNDSKATNVAAAVRALESFDAPVVLIAGGRGKGESFAPLAAAASARVKLALLIGEAQDDLRHELASAGVTAEACGTLPRALERASGEASARDVVLLSPACASYDQYTDFEQRGDEFRRLVQSRIRT